MTKKQLISADDVRGAAKSGQNVIHLRDKTTIVTAEARSVAKDLGVALELAAPANAPSAPTGPAEDTEHAAVRQVIEAHTHGPASDAVMNEVLRRIALERDAPAQGKVHKITSICSSPRTSDKGANMSHLDLTSVVSGGAIPRSAGFMGWSKNQFPLDCKSDELNLVLDGELQYHVGSDCIRASAGDVMWVPKGTQGKVGSPGSVRYFYLSYPV
jgi:ethanolamine utilization protein EutQ